MWGEGGRGEGWHHSVITEMRGCEKGQIAMTQKSAISLKPDPKKAKKPGKALFHSA